MDNYYIVADSFNKIEMSARRLGGKYLELYKKYWLELNQYKNYNFPDDLASRISKDAELAIKENITF